MLHNNQSFEISSIVPHFGQGCGSFIALKVIKGEITLPQPGHLGNCVDEMKQAVKKRTAPAYLKTLILVAIEMIIRTIPTTDRRIVTIAIVL